MTKNIELKFGLEHGDIRRIARKTLYHPNYVKMVLDGTKRNKNIIDAAEMLGAANKALEQFRRPDQIPKKQIL